MPTHVPLKYGREGASRVSGWKEAEEAGEGEPYSV